MGLNTTCPYTENTSAVDQSTFFETNGVDWDAHRIGWVVAGSFTAVTTLVTIISVWSHCRNYTLPRHQRQIIRILYMPMVYAIISFFSYRFFRAYTYYSLIESTYEALVIAAFLLLLIQFVADKTPTLDAKEALQKKSKQKLPLPFCCIRYRPTKPYFMYTLKYSVLQYCFVRPALTIAGIIAEKNGRLCQGSWSPAFASVYIDAIDFVSITIALYALIIFYMLTHDELKDKRPLWKFLSIKLIVFFTFFQGFVFDALASYGIIKATEFWTTTNIADGLNALTTCIEMLLFALMMLWAFPVKEYRQPGAEPTGIGRPLLDSINYYDFLYETWLSMRFFWDYIRGKPYARAKRIENDKISVHGYAAFDDAFGIEIPERMQRTDVEMPIYSQPPPPTRRRSAGLGASLGTPDARTQRYDTLASDEGEISPSQPVQAQAQGYAPPVGPPPGAERGYRQYGGDAQ
ncbi:DUF300-domain-containing protein [Dacryopinax primogenitus]|uniref:DUF300-domain-containing protein n=1 Tax=Dacryopinax primogenitus (strain DJM 731) TaxID=1858805 RepID=M5G3E9_DACPD|nr:DUF300-domain-containing protein [Dacryopinax primogenitus]EJT98287.1 DUF300-domain-containing protein [Dacryopinax primogenitus]